MAGQLSRLWELLGDKLKSLEPLDAEQIARLGFDLPFARVCAGKYHVLTKKNSTRRASKRLAVRMAYEEGKCNC